MPESVQRMIQIQLWELIPTVIYFVVGLALFGLSILLMEKVAPFSIRKEIEEDQNVALGILMGGMMIALAIVLAAAIT
jgi:putative membrane protein